MEQTNTKSGEQVTCELKIYWKKVVKLTLKYILIILTSNSYALKKLGRKVNGISRSMMKNLIINLETRNMKL